MTVYPVDEILPSLRDAMARCGAAVLHAPPGAGKTTRVPLSLLKTVSPEKGKIIMLEPRRIAAVSAARWMAKTIGEEAGETVGYSIRFERRVSAATRLEIVTEGILSRRIQDDPELRNVAMVIFDEFHERSLHADLSLALCLDVRKGLRHDLKILVMSATLDCARVASLLGEAPVISSAGKLYSVEERYLADREDLPFRDRIVAAIRTALRETAGDILVFLPGSGEIRACHEALSSGDGMPGINASIHPLYGDLPFEEQERAILVRERRKVVLATNIAETSLTIEGISTVIDSGFTRRQQFDPASGMNRLVTVPVSRAAAEQRKGRAGRLGPGVCYRLYSRHTFRSLVPFAPPEIKVSDLSSLVLDLSVWGVGDPSVLSWLDPPSSSACNAGKALLMDLGALDPNGLVTSAGRKMARLPLHPRLARLLQRAGELGVPGLGADLAALLSERDVMVRSSSRGTVHVSGPDIAARLEVLNAWRKGGALPAAADAAALRAVGRAAKQLMHITDGTERRGNEPTDDTVMIARLLLDAFPDRVGRRREEGAGRFVLSQGRGVRIDPASTLSMSPYIVAVNVDAGGRGEGVMHLGAPVTEELIREECAARIKTVRRIEWDRREERIVAAEEERLGAVLLAERPFSPTDEEVAPLLCRAIESAPQLLSFSHACRQLQGRVALMRRVFAEEDWPDLSEPHLSSDAGAWLPPWLGGIQSGGELAKLDLLPALRAMLSRNQASLLDERAPTHLGVPSGHRIALDYAAGDIPVLAVKLQEMFGLAETPAVAGGRVAVLLHLLSPAGRPVQITRDLKGFWNDAYFQVKKELKGRYPKHPWPDDPWNTAPTRRSAQRKR